MHYVYCCGRCAGWLCCPHWSAKGVIADFMENFKGFPLKKLLDSDVYLILDRYREHSTKRTSEASRVYHASCLTKGCANRFVYQEAVDVHHLQQHYSTMRNSLLIILPGTSWLSQAATMSQPRSRNGLSLQGKILQHFTKRQITCIIVPATSYHVCKGAFWCYSGCCRRHRWVYPALSLSE